MNHKGENMTSIRRGNRTAILQMLLETEGTSRKHLASVLNLTPAAITHITAELLEENLIREGNSVRGDRAGRREVILKVNEKAGVALGVLLNIGKMILSATYLDGSVLFTEELSIQKNASADELVPFLSERLRTLMNENTISPDSIVGTGIAIRGILSADERSVSDSFGAIKEKGYPLADRFEEALGVPAVLSNNVRALFSSELFLRRSNGDAEFFLRCEYGIGAAMSINGAIWRGANEQSAEIGHVMIVPRGGKLCSCGKCGCLETVSSPNAIVEDALAALSPDNTPVLYQISLSKEITLDDVFRAAQSGDTVILDIVDRAVSELVKALRGVIYLLDPSRITLYGRMFENPFYLSRFYGYMSSGIGHSHQVTTEKSRFNQQLENKCACLLAVNRFYQTGGHRA